mmetsp:Transcript_1548/g.4998  ORF Transcript_1548/g.4998 Transcript_1548/m.4998 type:complete len:281 (-) Transcript_1548:263-1105(-)
MLHLQKNKIVTGVTKQQIEIRQLEVDWYCGNYSTIAGQAAMLAGFAFAQLTTPMPEDYVPPLMLEFGYLVLTCTSIGLELSAIILSTFLSVWGPSLALRGRGGTSDLHRAVDCLRDYQFLVFLYFIVGWVIFFVSNILQVWIYFKRRVAVVVSFPLSLFICAILWYTFDITRKLRLDDTSAVVGKIDHFQPYEFIGDLDHGLHSNGLASGPRARGNFPGSKADGGYCPVHESLGETFRPRLASEAGPAGATGATAPTPLSMAGPGGQPYRAGPPAWPGSR